MATSIPSLLQENWKMQKKYYMPHLQWNVSLAMNFILLEPEPDDDMQTIQRMDH